MICKDMIYVEPREVNVTVVATREELEEEINFVFYLMGEMPINKWAHANVVLHFLIMLFSTSPGIYKLVFNLHVYNFI